MMIELKQQGQLGKIDFGNPKMQPMVKMLQGNIRREAMKWQPGAGIRLRRETFSIAGAEPFSCAILEPEEPSSRKACLFCHGGGMILPLQVSSLRVAEYIAREAGISVWAPDYHLPPTGIFPMPVEECACVWQEMTRMADKTVLYGESVGGALAASLAMHLRNSQAQQPDLLMLIDPVTDCETETYPSAALDAQAAWTLRNNRVMWEKYLPEGSAAQFPYAVPMRGQVDGLPPTYIETAEIDILRDEGEAFAEKLRAAGIPVELHRIADAWHGFDSEINHPYVQQTLNARVEALKKALK